MVYIEYILISLLGTARKGMKTIRAIAYNCFLWKVLKKLGHRIGLIRSKQKISERSDLPCDPRLKEIKSFDAWIEYIRERDSLAVEELTRLGQGVIKQEKKGR